MVGCCLFLHTESDTTTYIHWNESIGGFCILVLHIFQQPHTCWWYCDHSLWVVETHIAWSARSALASLYPAPPHTPMLQQPEKEIMPFKQSLEAKNLIFFITILCILNLHCQLLVTLSIFYHIYSQRYTYWPGGCHYLGPNCLPHKLFTWQM